MANPPAPTVLTADQLLAGTSVTADPLASIMSQPGAPASPFAASSTPAPAAEPVKLSGQMVRAINPKGEVVDVPTENWARAEAMGFEKDTPQKAAVRSYLAENKGISGDLKVGLSQFANQALMGIPELIYEKTGDPLEVAKHEALKKEHAISNAVGGVGGFAASLAVGGPLFKGATMAGQAVERAVLAGTERALAGRLAAAGTEQGAKMAAKAIVAKSLASAAKMGTEGAALAAPMAITEAALGDPETAGETLLYGMGAGAALGVFAPGAKELMTRATKGLAPSGAAAKLEEIANSQAVKSHNPYKRISDRLAEIPGGEQAAGRIMREKNLVRGIGESFEDLTARIEAEQNATGKSIGSFYDQLDEKGVTIDSRELARDLRREVLAPLKEKVGFESRAAKLEKYIESFEGKVGVGELPQPPLIAEPTMPKVAPVKESEVLRDLKKQYPEADFRRSVKLQNLVTETAAQRTAERQAQAMAAFEADTVRVQQENAERLARWEHLNTQPQSLRATELQAIKGDLQTLIYGERLPSPDQIDTQLKSVRDMFKSTLDGKVAEHLGEGAALELKKLNGEYRVLDILKKGSQSNIGRDITNRTNSLTDYLLGSSASAAGAMAGTAIGGPLGGMVAGGASQLIGMFGNKYLRQNFNALASMSAGKLGLLFAEQSMRKTALELDRIPEILRDLGTKGFKAAPTRAITSFAGDEVKDRAAHFATLSKQITEAQSNMPQTLERVGGIAGALADGGAPQVGQAWQAAQMRALQYLYDTMPKAPRPVPFAKEEWKPSDKELAGWYRRVEVANDVSAPFRHLEAGTLMKEHVEALQQLAPKLYAEMVKRVELAAADPNAPQLSSSVRDQLSSLLGIPLERGGPEAARRLQASFSKASAQKSPDGLRANVGKIPSPETELQRVMTP